jgi:hypothetical protein
MHHPHRASSKEGKEGTSDARDSAPHCHLSVGERETSGDIACGLSRGSSTYVFIQPGLREHGATLRSLICLCMRQLAANRASKGDNLGIARS